MAKLIRNKLIRSIGKAIKRRIPSRSFAFLQFLSWLVVLYVPCQACRWMSERKPRIRSFGGNNASLGLAAKISGVRLRIPTRSCRIMSWYGSDKGCFRHNYTMVYESLFRELMNQRLRIFELGLGTNNEGISSTMGSCGSPGASLRGWRKLFPNALVFGADIDRGVLFEEERIKTFYCDQLDQTAIKELWEHEELRDGMDIVIEDGLHTLEANISFLDGSLKHVRPGGYYVIEDIAGKFMEDWFELLEKTYTKQYPTYEFVFTILPSSHKDNNLLIIHKPANAAS
jgi:hypothetical protein